MKNTAHMAGEALTALLLAAALSLGGIFAAGQVTRSALYRQSKIISSIFSDKNESMGIRDMFGDARSRAVLLKFAGALADAYVSFEFIPLNEASTFAAVYESIGQSVEIDGFSYRRKNLIIAGTSPDESGYIEFMHRLKATKYFDSVSGHYDIAASGLITFEIQCLTDENF